MADCDAVTVVGNLQRVVRRVTRALSSGIGCCTSSFRRHFISNEITSCNTVEAWQAAVQMND